MAKRVATDADRVQSRRRVPTVVSVGEPLTNLAGMFASVDDITFPFPADVCCELAADALRIAGATRTSPVSLAGAPERFLPDFEYRGNTARQKLRAALELAIAIHAGIEPDYDDRAGWWRVQDLDRFALYAAVIMIGLAAEQTGTSVADVCRQLDDENKNIA